MTEAVLIREQTPEFAQKELTNGKLDLAHIRPDISHIITEDDEPVDTIPSKKNQRLLVEVAYASELERPLFAAANVGLFGAIYQQPLVPDVMLSLGVTVADDWWARANRSYFIWEFGKVPDVGIEIVSNSNTEGEEAGRKLLRSAQWGVPYYAIYDPPLLIQQEALVVYELQVGQYLPRPDFRLPRINLALTVWEGIFEDKFDRWLRWCDAEGNLLHTNAELAEQERQRAEQTQTRADRYAAQLRALGIDPDQLLNQNENKDEDRQ